MIHLQSKKNKANICTLFLTTKFSDKELSKLRWLHTLILNCEDIIESLDSIKVLIHLKYLDTANTKIETLPKSIDNLYLFQTLRVTTQHGGKSYLRKLTVLFKYLISSRHLHISRIQLPPEEWKLTSLQTLTYFCVNDEVEHQIEKIGKLTNLRGELEISKLGNIRDKEEVKSVDLFHKPNIYKLKMVWNNEDDPVIMIRMCWKVYNLTRISRA